MPRIVVIGSLNMDLVATAPHIPLPGETVLGSSFNTALGGKGANQAVAAARLGAQVKMIGRVGDDEYGKAQRSGLAEDGVDTTYVNVDPGVHTGIALIMVDTAGENSIVVVPGANARLASTDVDVATQAIVDADVMVMQLEVPIGVVEHAAVMAHDHGVHVMLNPAPAQELGSELMANLDTLVLNESETKILTDIAVEDLEKARSAALILHQRGVETVVITLGGEGAFFSKHDHAQLIPAFQVNTVDTTAAGDAFMGALAVAIAKGIALPRAVRFAAAAGALATTKLGAQPSLPTLEAVEELL